MLRVLLAIDDYGEMVYLQTLLKKLGFDVDGVQSQRAFVGKQLGFNPQVVLATANGRRVNGIELAEGLIRRQGIPKFILLAHPNAIEGLDLSNLKNVDGHLESPVNVQSLLETIARVGSIDAKGLLEKYNRMKATLQPDEEGDLTLLKGVGGSGANPTNEKIVVSGGAADPNDLTLVSGTLSQAGAKPQGRVEDDVAAAGENSLEAAHQPAHSVELSSEVREARFRKYLAELPTPTVNGFTREKVMAHNRELRRSEDPDALRDLEEERRGFVKNLFRAGKKKTS